MNYSNFSNSTNIDDIRNNIRNNMIIYIYSTPYVENIAKYISKNMKKFLEWQERL